jgi:hypothetical protein
VFLIQDTVVGVILGDLFVKLFVEMALLVQMNNVIIEIKLDAVVNVDLILVILVQVILVDFLGVILFAEII